MPVQPRQINLDQQLQQAIDAALTLNEDQIKYMTFLNTILGAAADTLPRLAGLNDNQRWAAGLGYTALASLTVRDPQEKPSITVEPWSYVLASAEGDLNKAKEYKQILKKDTELASALLRAYQTLGMKLLGAITSYIEEGEKIDEATIRGIWGEFVRSALPYYARAIVQNLFKG